MAINWASIQQRYDELTGELTSPALDVSKRHIYQKEHSYLNTLLSKNNEIASLKTELVQATTQAQQNDDAELKELFDAEITDLETKIKYQEAQLDHVMFPPDPLNNRSIFLEIRAGTGGQEAALFAGDLARMYTNYALNKNWRVSIVSASQTDLKGYRELILHIEGKDVFGHLKFESGVHRVQRVPQTETQGRIHTSTATVAVMPEAEEVEYSISPNDLRIDVFRSGGAGGQHVNTTDSAVRITHIPSGLVVSCQDERSQHKNKAKAMKVLQSRLLSLHKEKQDAENSKMRKEMVGTGERAEKVRTYNFPQNRVTDHQVEVTLKNLDRFIEGAIDDIIDPLMAKEAADRRSRPVQI